MITQSLLTFGAIPAISIDTPQYPEERQRGGGWGRCTLRDDAAHTHRHVLQSIQNQAAVALKCGWEGQREGHEDFYFFFFLKGCFCEG